MTFKPGKRFFEAVLNLQGNIEFEKIITEFQKYHLDAGLHFPHIDGPALVKLQGAAAFVLEFLTSADPNFARAELDRLKLVEMKPETRIPY